MLIPPEPPNLNPPTFTPKNDLEYLQFWTEFQEYYRQLHRYATHQTIYFRTKLDQKEGK